MIIADTSIWISYQRDPASEVGSEFESLLITDSIAMVGPVMAEILHGCRSDVEYDFYVGRLDGLQFLDADQETWVLVGELGYRLLRHGVTVPFSDLVISAIAIQNGLPVYTLDDDFQRVPGLTLYQTAQ